MNRSRTTRLHYDGFGRVILTVPHLDGAKSIILATSRYGFRPYAILLPHQVVLADALDKMRLHDARELWALPVGVEGAWVQLVGPDPGSTHPKPVSDYMTEGAADERDTLCSMLAGRCLSDITHRDEEHRQSVCMLPEGHAPLMHDDCMGCTWTDAEHWEPSAIDALAATVERVRAVHARYFDLDEKPGDANPEPEDVWRFDRDLRAALDGEVDR